MRRPLVGVSFWRKRRVAFRMKNVNRDWITILSPGAMPQTEPINLLPTAPFDFEQSLEYLADFSIAQGEQSIEKTRLTRAIPVHGRPVAFELWSEGTVEEPK